MQKGSIKLIFASKTFISNMFEGETMYTLVEEKFTAIGNSGCYTHMGRMMKSCCRILIYNRSVQ